MKDFVAVLMILISLGFFAWLTFYFTKRYFSKNKSDLADLSEKMLGQLNQVTGQVNARLRENIEIMQRQSQDLNSRLDNTQRVVQTVTNKLSTLEESSRRIFEVGKDISSLHDILKAPKLRGGLGEYVLGDILEQTLPQDNYKLQHAFKDGEKVDAIVKLRDMIIPIDAKFPLENFKKILVAKDKEEKIRIKKEFMRDVKKHVEDIRQKYIRPNEGTSDFALMYVPAENVYYEIIIKEKDEDSLTNFALAKKVIPVSPNSFYAYLQAILIGLKGLQIEKGAKEILTHLSHIKIEFQKFGQDFELLGKHLLHARAAYQTSQKKLDKFNDSLAQVESPKKIKKLSQ